MDIPDHAEKHSGNSPSGFWERQKWRKFPCSDLFIEMPCNGGQRQTLKKGAKSVKKLKIDSKKDISIVIAPEGTFNMTAKPLEGIL